MLLIKPLPSDYKVKEILFYKYFIIWSIIFVTGVVVASRSFDDQRKFFVS